MNFKWLPGWYATRLHAISEKEKFLSKTDSRPSVCGAYVYEKAPTEWARKRVKKGIPKCKHCERMSARILSR